MPNVFQSDGSVAGDHFAVVVSRYNEPITAKLLDGVQYGDDAYSILEGADCVAILTEWNEFRALDLTRVRELLAHPVMVDLRNIYKPSEMAGAGFAYYSVGRPSVQPDGEEQV